MYQGSGQRNGRLGSRKGPFPREDAVTFDFRWQPLNWKPLTAKDLRVGWEREWDVPITYPLIAWYADLAQDPHHWYSQRGSPFGPPVAPPLLMSRLASQLTDSLGRMMGFLNTYNRTETLAPTVVGTVVRFQGRIDDLSERRGRLYVRLSIQARDAESGTALLREIKEFVVAPDGAITSDG